MLYMRCANVGFAQVGMAPLGRASTNAASMAHSLHRSAQSSLAQWRVRPRPLSHAGDITGGATAANDDYDLNAMSDERRRKAQRLQNIRLIEHDAMYTVSVTHRMCDNCQTLTNGQKRRQLSRELFSIKQLRANAKQQTLIAAVYQHLTTVHTLFPSMGSAEFVEYRYTNACATPMVIEIEVSHVSLR